MTPDSLQNHVMALDCGAEKSGLKAKQQLCDVPSGLQLCLKGDAVAVAQFAQGSVDDALQAKLGQTGAEDAFFVADLGEVARQHAQWSKLLPRVQPFYAVKCNPDVLVMRQLAQLGAGFDCASRAELALALGAGAVADDIIYAHPCKPASHLRFAATQGVELMTFDNADELAKISDLHPRARAVLRILADDSGARCRLGLKFGAAPETADALLRTALELGIDVVGVSFHVGSGCESEAAYADAVLRARRVFDQAAALGLRFSLLDVGGGFPGRSEPSGLAFDAVARVLAAALDRHFPRDHYAHVRVIAEPGRYYVASAFTLAVNVVARRRIDAESGPAFMYYVNDGVYGSFNCIVFDHQHPRPRLLRPSASQRTDAPLYPASLWGPTCDSMDCIVRDGLLLPELSVGDWLAFDDMGAYSMSAASRFNGFKLSDIVYVDTERIFFK
ncbi:Ornithine decarboxylase [Coemansia sp. BCRC 34301]|nr:Ornithine decarboxylase [Coemansia sp. BCRC 34301]